MEYVVSGFSDIGKRKINQDAYTIQIADTENGKAVLACVCDGVGGLQCGERASATAVAYFTAWFRNVFCAYSSEKASDAEEIRHEICRQIEKVNRSIMQCTKSMQMHSATTVVIALLYQRYAVIANVGDSRGYHIQNGLLRQITEDHTFAKLHPEKDMTPKEKNMLYQCIGANETVKPDSRVLALRPNDSVVLCSDGAYKKLSPREIIAANNCALFHDSKQMRVSQIMSSNKVKARGECDNITMINVLAL